jgi:MFS family permease
MLKRFFNDSNITRRDFSIVFILLVNAFAWLYMMPLMISDIIISANIAATQELIVWSAYYGAIIISSIIGSIISTRINRLKFIYTWIVLGVLSSLAPTLITSFSLTGCFTISILLGASFGLGMPSCLAYFADITQIENRGRISGITLLTSMVIVPVFAIIFSAFSLTINLIIFAAWRSIALTAFFLKPNKTPAATQRNDNNSFAGIIKDKTFGFYLLAWLMFCLVDRIGGPIVSSSLDDLSGLLSILGPIIASISALVTGILSDWVGRKRIVLYGFIALGIAYAIAGLAPDVTLAKYLVVLISSVTTGILFVTFILILWGDLSQFGSREKYYAVGEIPLFITNIFELFMIQYAIQIPETSAFSVAALFLFVAILPLYYAPETLPQKKMELRRLRKFAEEAQKAKEKFENKK